MKSLLFLSTCSEAWGGSEVLWSSAAQRLARAGHAVTAYKPLVEPRRAELAQLVASGVRLFDARPERRFALTRALLRLDRRVAETIGRQLLRRAIDAVRPRPDLVLISQAENFDGLRFAELCRRRGLPYALLAQKANDAVWPDDHTRRAMKAAYRGARRCFFVSTHNRALTEAQLGEALPHAEVVWNPWTVHAPAPLPWPEPESALEPTSSFRLACVGRLWVPDKGQDILLRVLARPAWRARPLHVSFFGDGAHRPALEGMARWLGLERVSFCGFTRDMTAVWRAHHALVLPSRAEGRSLAMIEAMMCGRPCIATASAGGVAEMVEDGETGFLAAAASDDPLADALERAWHRRADWQAMGAEAARRIRACAPTDPVGDLVERLLMLC